MSKKKPEEKVDEVDDKEQKQSLKPYRHIERPIFSGKKEDFKEWSERADVWLWRVKKFGRLPWTNTYVCFKRRCLGVSDQP